MIRRGRQIMFIKETRDQTGCQIMFIKEAHDQTRASDHVYKRST